MSSIDFAEIDFLRPGPYYQDPYPYFDYLRSRAPVWREPHHGVVMVTGYDECVEVYRDSTTYSNCALMAGPFARWPVPLEGDDISDIIERYRDQLPLSDQLVTFDPPKHTAHRALLGQRHERGGGGRLQSRSRKVVHGSRRNTPLLPGSRQGTARAENMASRSTPGWEDWDSDGNPGISGSIPGAVTGKIFVASRVGRGSRAAASFWAARSI
jgi:hypothetical protein